jgi:hypothetical protein
MPTQGRDSDSQQIPSNGRGFSIYAEHTWKSNISLRLRWKTINYNSYKFTYSPSPGNEFENEEKVSSSEYILEGLYYPNMKYLPYVVAGLGGGDVRWSQKIKTRWELEDVTAAFYYGLGWDLTKYAALEFIFRDGRSKSIETSLSLHF